MAGFYWKKMVYGDNKGLELDLNWLFYPVEHSRASVRCGPMRSEASIAPAHPQRGCRRIPVDPGALGEDEMTAIGARSFKKTAACPSETILISYRTKKLAPEIMNLVKAHLGSCDFCSAELGLLGYYSHPQRGECRAPDIPMNLRVLAESLL